MEEKKTGNKFLFEKPLNSIIKKELNKAPPE
jgi:hypothetical protein